MQVQRVIELLGFSPKEARVYLAVLSLGEAHISDIAEKADLPRSSVQVIAEKLQKNGLLNFYVQRRYKFWTAEDPERLLRILIERESEVRSALPSLVALKRAGRKSQRARGASSARNLLRAWADTLEQPVLITNDRVEIVYVNLAWEREFGYVFNEVQGEHPRMFQSGTTPRQEYDRMWSALRSGTLFQSDAIVDKRKDGSCFRMRTTIFPAQHNGITFYVQILGVTGF